MIKKTKYSSYCLNGIADGCKKCVVGKKLVLFISGICSEKCWYCSLSEKRKNKDIIWVNERKCLNVVDMIKEAKESNAKGCGITGGDPLLFLKRTLTYARALKRKFGKKFHIHIYLPTKLVDEKKLKKLSKVIDEVRFHPKFLIDKKKEKQDIKKIKLAKKFWKKENIGIELPLIPELKREILNFILKVKEDIGFVNLNELEISDTNFNIVTKRYKLKENGYVVADSKKAGLWVLGELKKNKIKLKLHLCTAELKNWHQYKNRLLRHKILPFSKRTRDGTIIYFAVNGKIQKIPAGIFCLSKSATANNTDLQINSGYYDKKKKRTIIPAGRIRKLKNRYKILRIEEYPTYDRDEVERWEI